MSFFVEVQLLRSRTKGYSNLSLKHKESSEGTTVVFNFRKCEESCVLFSESLLAQDAGISLSVVERFLPTVLIRTEVASMSCSSTSTFGKRLLRCLLEEDDRKVDSYRARGVTTEDEIVGKTVVVEGETMETNCTAMETTMQGEDFLHAIELIGGRSETTGVTSVETYDHFSERNKEDEKMSDDEEKEETSMMTSEGGPGVSRNCEANESHEEGQEEEIQTQTEVFNAENTGGDEERQEKDDVDDDESVDSSEEEEDVEEKGNDSDFNPDSEEVEEEPEDEVEEESEDDEKEEDESEREGDQGLGTSDEDDRPSKKGSSRFQKIGMEMKAKKARPSTKSIIFRGRWRLKVYFATETCLL